MVVSEESQHQWNRNILEIGEGLAEYVARHSIENVVLLDRAARQAYIPLEYALRYRPHSVKKPEMFFLRPQGLDKGLIPVVSPFLKRRTFRTVHPRFYNRRELPTLMFDVCIHTGKHAKMTDDFLRKVGFSNLHLVIGSACGSSRVIEPNAILCPEFRGCHPLARYNRGFLTSVEVVEPHYEGCEGKESILCRLSGPEDGNPSRLNRKKMHDFLEAYYSGANV